MPSLSFQSRFFSFVLGKSGGLPMSDYTGGQRYAGNAFRLFGLLPGAKVDYERLAGDRWKNPVVAAALAWIWRNLPQAPPCVYQMQADGEEVLVPGHPLTALLKRPNPYNDGRTLRQATFLSLVAGKGNAYWWIKKGPSGLPIELWWLPHFDVWPYWLRNADTNHWIEGYVYRNNGKFYLLPEEDVVHFRDGLDPEYMRLGADLLRAASREIVTDQEASGYEAAMMRQYGVTGAIISAADAATEIDEATALTLKAQWEEQTQSDNRFRPVVLSAPVKVDRTTYSPQEMSLETVQDRPEARICAIIGINPVVLGLTVGLEHSKYANMEEAERGAWRNGIIPRLELIHSELDTQLLTLYPPSQRANLRVGADYRRVIALQDNLDATYKRITAAVGGPWMTVNEGRQNAGMDTLPGYDLIYPPKAGGAQPEPDPEGDEPNPPAADNAKKNGHAKNGKSLAAT